MSLRVWLPLDGDLKQQGASNIIATASNATVNASGKIGSCYAFNNSNSYIQLEGNDLYSIIKGGSDPFSICFWVFHADTTRAIIFGDYGLTGTINFNIELGTNHSVRFYWNGSPDKTFNSTSYVAASGWTHIAITYNGSAINIYKDGILSSDAWTGTLATKNKTSGVYYLGRDSRTGNTTLNGRLNDFRIYDHCLSTAEVKEIAQGLVLHYKLDSFQGNYGNPNLCKNSRTFGTGWGGSGTVISDTFNGFAIKYKDNSSGTSYTDTVGYSGVTTVNPNEVYTVSFWAKADTAHGISCFFYNNASGIVQCARSVTSLGNSNTSGDGHITITLTTEWKYYWITWTFGSSGNAANKSLLLGRNTAGSSGVSFSQVKLERGSSATAWAPHPDDDDYLPMIVEDNSGYNHSGEVLNTPSLISDTPRYNSCLHISATNQKIKISNFPTSGFGNSYSFSWWAKISSASPMHWGFADGIRLNGMYTGRLWNTGDSSSNPLYKPGTTTQVDTPTANVWHHWVMTGDGTTCKVYQDGVHWATAKTYKAISGQTIYINGWDSGTNYSSNDYSISDFRIYCTALDADAVRQLYEVGAKVDNKQSLHTFELNETNTNLLQGILWCSPFSSHTPLTSPFTNYNSDGEPQFTSNGGSAGTDYIEISPTVHTYEYDYTISVNTGNQFYIGFERYDANKTARSNNACVYTFASKPSSNIVKQHYTGTINLATDGTNPCKYVALRILNGWSGTTSGVTGNATIHSISLRQIGTKQQPEITKTGLCIGEELKEETNTKLHKNGIIETNNLIEL